MSVDKVIPRIQRALVLQGGGALGAYEAGVLNTLCKNLRNEDRKNGEENRLLFDVIAGTSIGAINAAILVSQFLETQSWNKAAVKLEKFWIKQLSLKSLDISELSKPWYDKWVARNSTAASEEAARRYYSVKKLLVEQVRNNMHNLDRIIEDNKFFDNMYTDKGPNDDNPDCKDPNCKKPNFLNNVWFLHSSKPLQESIAKFVRFPIITDRKKGQPRLLVFSVDVTEGSTVTFDSYSKADGCRKSEYGRYRNGNGYEIVINYNDGIGLEHIMASGTLSEFYNYAEVHINPTTEQKNQHSEATDKKCNKNNNDNIRYFWDGGLLSNTPFRELLNAHQQYWKDVENRDEIPALDVYIVNVHPSKISIDRIPKDHDGVKDRHNDIIYGDRTSYHDENTAHLIAHYTDFATEMKHLIEEAICKVNLDDKDALKKKLEDILAMKIFDNDGNERARSYQDLIRGRFKLNNVIRIERSNYINSIYGKIGDLTLETISRLVKEGEYDALFSLIQYGVNEIPRNADMIHIQDNLIDILNQAILNLRNNDYEDNNSHTYRKLTEFINEVKKNKEFIDKSKKSRSDRLIELTDKFRASLD